MSGLDFSFSPVKEKPRRGYRKGSKYDQIIDQFISSDMNLVTLNVPSKEPNYVRLQIDKRIKKRNLKEKINVSVVNKEVYLEKL
jgi:hypothetical protein